MATEEIFRLIFVLGAVTILVIRINRMRRAVNKMSKTGYRPEMQIVSVDKHAILYRTNENMGWSAWWADAVHAPAQVRDTKIGEDKKWSYYQKDLRETADAKRQATVMEINFKTMDGQGVTPAEHSFWWDEYGRG